MEIVTPVSDAVPDDGDTLHQESDEAAVHSRLVEKDTLCEPPWSPKDNELDEFSVRYGDC